MVSADQQWFAWAAGIIDGEGCIYLRRKRGKRCDWWELFVEVTNTDIKMLNKLRGIFGGCISRHHRARHEVAAHPHWKTAWRWKTTRIQAEHVIQLVYPWLVTKRDQADVALLSRKYRGRGGRGYVLPDGDALRWCYERLRELKSDPTQPACPMPLTGQGDLL